MHFTYHCHFPLTFLMKMIHFLVNLGSSLKNLGVSPIQERPLQFLALKAEVCDTRRNETREMSRPIKKHALNVRS